MFDLYEAPTPLGEVIGASLRKLSVAPQAVEVRVDATMIRFEVQALLVASNANALRRFHYFYEVEFTDGTTGDNGLNIIGGIKWPEEVVFFTEDGLEITIPFEWGQDESVIFREESIGLNYAISNTEFVKLADYSVRYVLDFLSNETFRFSDLSLALMGVVNRFEFVTVVDTVTTKGDVSDVATMAEFVTLSETLVGANAFIFGDAVFMNEMWLYVMDYALQPEFVTLTDALVVSAVAATDARPGAFVPAAALLGSPQ